MSYITDISPKMHHVKIKYKTLISQRNSSIRILPTVENFHSFNLVIAGQTEMNYSRPKLFLILFCYQLTFSMLQFSLI